jgi:hypothetical protein
VALKQGKISHQHLPEGAMGTRERIEMTFEEVENSLPKGFHDATLLQLSLDSMERRATVKISVHVSSDRDQDRELYRVGVLEVKSVSLFFIEPPDPNYKFAFSGRGVGVSGDSVALGQSPAIDPLLKKLPSDAKAYRFFLEEWNSFFYLAASEVAISWEEE